MPQTEYRFDKIHSGIDYTRSPQGGRFGDAAPALRLWVGKSNKRVEIPLTEEGLQDIIRDSVAVLAVLRIQRERDAHFAAQAAAQVAQ